MPQPIDQVRRDARLNFGNGALTRSPLISQLMMQVIGIWAHIDGNITYAFSTFLRTDIETATALFDQFQGARNRERALIAAAKTALPEWQSVAVEAVCKATAASRNTRNQFAHFITGYSQDIPDALLLVHPREITAVNVSRRQPTQHLSSGGKVVAFREIDRSQVFVWRESDLNTAVAEARLADEMFILLAMSIGYGRNEVARRQLFTMERFQRATSQLLRDADETLKEQLAPPGDNPPAPGIWKLWDETLKRDMAYWDGRGDVN